MWYFWFLSILTLKKKNAHLNLCKTSDSFKYICILYVRFCCSNKCTRSSYHTQAMRHPYRWCLIPDFPDHRWLRPPACWAWPVLPAPRHIRCPCWAPNRLICTEAPIPTNPRRPSVSVHVYSWQAVCISTIVITAILLFSNYYQSAHGCKSRTTSSSLKHW